MKKIFAVLLAISMTMAFVGCSITVELGKDNASSTQTETSTAEQTEEPTVKQTEENEPATTQKKTEKPTEAIQGLSSQEQYRINIFLSNFSEQDFSDYDSSNVSDEQLVTFAYLHNMINNYSKMKIEDDYYGTFSLDVINNTLDRYFGKSIHPSQGQMFGQYYHYADSKIYCPMASGASHGTMTVVDSLKDLGDGTLKADFKIYTVDQFNTGGNRITDTSYYYFTPEKAKNSTETTYQRSGTAIVKRKEYNGTSTFELIKYDV